MTIFAASWGRNPDSARKAFLESLPKKFAKFTMGDED